MQFEEILRHFDVRCRSGETAQCICPCHGDRKASLSITHKVDRTLLYCHAGCDTRDILEAAGLQMAELFDQEKRRSGGVQPNARWRNRTPPSWKTPAMWHSQYVLHDKKGGTDDV